MGAWLHGSHSLLLAYSAIQVPMFAALWRARAQLHQYALSPLVAAPLTLIAGLGATAADALVPHSGLLVGMVLGVTLGYRGGTSLGRGSSAASPHQRGSMVEERSAADLGRGSDRSRN